MIYFILTIANNLNSLNIVHKDQQWLADLAEIYRAGPQCLHMMADNAGIIRQGSH